ncbi:MAG: radical SAM protein [Candidatus Methanomethylicia archaeon]
MFRVVIDSSRCRRCNFCSVVARCFSSPQCSGCLACYYACPYEARILVKSEAEGEVKVTIDGVDYRFPSNITIARALELIGFRFSDLGFRGLSLACRIGGCWTCMVLVDGEPKRSCITPIRDGIRIETNIGSTTPRRIVHGPDPHIVGGKATPWWEVDGVHYVEAAIWVAGCNLRCPQCQNYSVTYDNVSTSLTPREAAEVLTLCSQTYKTRGLAISGGEPTLNREWLVEFFRELKRLNPNKRLHLDSNGTLLSPEYIDELVESGCNNIGVEPKALRLNTYMEITGIHNQDLARKYLNTSWMALEYLASRYMDRVYIGVGIAYNKAWMTVSELTEIGAKIYSINPNLQVTVLDYFPVFRRRNIERPSVMEMVKVKKILEDQGLVNVIVQTSRGHIPPSRKIKL